MPTPLSETNECGEKTKKGYRTRLQNFIPLIVILLFWFLSLSIRFAFRLDGIGLSVGEAINELVKVAISIGLAWLFLRRLSPPYKKEFPKTDALIDLLIMGGYLLAEYLLFFQLPYSIFLSLFLLGITYVIIVVFTIRHYERKEIRLFLKDLGLSVPLTRIVICWVVTLLIFFSLIFLNAGENLHVFLQDYLQTTQIDVTLVYWPHTLRILFLWLVPEELLFRVYLQTRLEKLMPVGWAIIVQSLLFNLVHIPSNAVYLGWGWGFLPHFANTILVINGLIGGYLWYKTRNLPVLVLYHWTIYPLLPLIFFPS